MNCKTVILLYDPQTKESAMGYVSEITSAGNGRRVAALERATPLCEHRARPKTIFDITSYLLGGFHKYDLPGGLYTMRHSAMVRSIMNMLRVDP